MLQKGKCAKKGLQKIFKNGKVCKKKEWTKIKGFQKQVRKKSCKNGYIKYFGKADNIAEAIM